MAYETNIQYRPSLIVISGANAQERADLADELRQFYVNVMRKATGKIVPIPVINGADTSPKDKIMKALETHATVIIDGYNPAHDWKEITCEAKEKHKPVSVFSSISQLEFPSGGLDLFHGSVFITPGQSLDAQVKTLRSTVRDTINRQSIDPITMCEAKNRDNVQYMSDFANKPKRPSPLS
jgi:hypothetical protein